VKLRLVDEIIKARTAANGAGVVLFVPDVIAMESEMPDHSALDPLITSMPAMPRVPLKAFSPASVLGETGWGGSAASPLASPPIWTPASFVGFPTPP